LVQEKISRKAQRRKEHFLATRQRFASWRLCAKNIVDFPARRSTNLWRRFSACAR